MPPQDMFQLGKFNNMLAKVSDSIDSGQGDPTKFIDEVKHRLQLQEELKAVYEEWERSGFDINFRFRLTDCSPIRETTLLHIAILCRKNNVCVPIVRCLLDKGDNPNDILEFTSFRTTSKIILN